MRDKSGIIWQTTLAAALLWATLAVAPLPAHGQIVRAVPPPVAANDVAGPADTESGDDGELRLVEGILTRAESTAATRQDAAMLLMKRNTPAARSILSAALGRTNQPDVQLGVLVALAAQKNPDRELLPEVLRLARHENLAGRVRDALPPAIAAYRDDDSIDTVVRAVVNSTLAAEQATLAVALGITGEKMAVEPMIALLGSESSLVRAAAAESLRSITTVEGFGESSDRWRQWWEEHRLEPREQWLGERVRVVEGRLTHRNQQLAEMTRRAVLLQEAALKNLAPADRLETVMRLLDDAVPEMRRLAAQESRRMLADERDPPAEFVNKLLLRLADESPQVRLEMAATVSALADNRRAAEQLMKRLSEERDHLVRGALVDALGELRHGPSVGELVKLLQGGDANLAVRAAQALGRIGERGTPSADSVAEAIEPLATLLRSNDGEQGAMLREAAVRALMKLGRDEITPPLVRALADPVPTIRLFAAQGLGNIGKADARTVEALLRCLADSDKGVRLSVADSVGRVSDGSGVTALAARLNPTGGENEPEVKAALWRSLIEIQRRSADAASIEALADEFAQQATVESAAGAAQMYELAISKMVNGQDRSNVMKRKLADAHLAANQPGRAAVVLRELLAIAENGHQKVDLQDRLGRLLVRTPPYIEGVDLMILVAEARQGEARAAAISAISAQAQQLLADGRAADAHAMVRRTRSRLGNLYKESAEAEKMDNVFLAARRKLLEDALKNLDVDDEAVREEAHRQTALLGKDEPIIVLKQLEAALAGDNPTRLARLERLLPHIRPDSVSEYEAAASGQARLEVVRRWIGGA